MADAFSPRPLIITYLKQWEGFRPLPYRCPAGCWTVGYGHVIRKEEDFSSPLTEKEAENLLLQDLACTARSLTRYIQTPLTPYQCDALLSFTFNVGAGALQRSTLRRKVNREEHNAVPQELLRWIWAGGRKHRGLILRRRIEGCIYTQTIQ